jgi:hypothetical protein
MDAQPGVKLNLGHIHVDTLGEGAVEGLVPRRTRAMATGGEKARKSAAQMPTVISRLRRAFVSDVRHLGK